MLVVVGVALAALVGFAIRNGFLGQLDRCGYPARSRRRDAHRH